MMITYSRGDRKIKYSHLWKGWIGVDENGAGWVRGFPTRYAAHKWLGEK